MNTRISCYSALLPFIAFALISFGYINLSEGLRYKTPKTITYEQFTKLHPSAGWFKVTGACLSVLEGANPMEKRSNSDVETADTSHLFIPMRSTTQEDQSTSKSMPPIRVLVNTKRVEAVHMYYGLSIIPAKKLATLQPDQMFLFGDITGMVGNELHSGDTSDDTLTKGLPNLAPDFIMFDEGATPSVALGAVMMCGGLAIAAVLILAFMAGHRKRMQG